MNATRIRYAVVELETSIRENRCDHIGYIKNITGLDNPTSVQLEISLTELRWILSEIEASGAPLPTKKIKAKTKENIDPVANSTLNWILSRIEEQ